MAYKAKFDSAEQVDIEEQIASILFDDPDIEISETTATDAGRRILRAVLTRVRPDLVRDTPLYMLIARKNGASRTRRQRKFATLDELTKGIARWRKEGFNTWWAYAWLTPMQRKLTGERVESAEGPGDYVLQKQWNDGGGSNDFGSDR